MSSVQRFDNYSVMFANARPSIGIVRPPLLLSRYGAGVCPLSDTAMSVRTRDDDIPLKWASSQPFSRCLRFPSWSGRLPGIVSQKNSSEHTFRARNVSSELRANKRPSATRSGR